MEVVHIRFVWIRAELEILSCETGHSCPVQNMCLKNFNFSQAQEKTALFSAFWTCIFKTTQMSFLMFCYSKVGESSQPIKGIKKSLILYERNLKGHGDTGLLCYIKRSKQESLLMCLLLLTVITILLNYTALNNCAQNVKYVNSK